MHSFWSIFGTKKLSEVVSIWSIYFFFSPYFLITAWAVGTILLDIVLKTKMSLVPTCRHSRADCTWAANRGETRWRDLGFTDSYSLVTNQTHLMAKLNTERLLMLFNLYYSISLLHKVHLCLHVRVDMERLGCWHRKKPGVVYSTWTVNMVTQVWPGS